MLTTKLRSLGSCTHAGATARSRGVAMLIVITILVTMVLVALPFALSMRQGQDRTQAVGARARARLEAESLAEIAKLYLGSTTPWQEQKRANQGGMGVDSMPLVDSLAEITPNDAFRSTIENEIITMWEKDPSTAGRAKYLKSRGLGPMNDDRGSIWTVLIEDAQARVNVNGGQMFLLANLMGSALLADEVDTGGGDIAVEHVVTGRFGGLRGFNPKGGYIRIGREVIKYEEFDGEAFRGCERGVLMGTPLGDNGTAQAHKRGVPVIDYTAYKLATHIIASRPGELAPFENLESLRAISGWGEDGVLSADRLERVLPYLTVWSKRESSATWLADQLVMNELPGSLDGGEPEELQLRDFRANPSGTSAYLNPGCIARISNGVRSVYQVIDQVGDREGRRRDAFATTAGSVSASVPESQREHVKYQGGETKVAALAPYPININTASREVLYAVMANVQLWRAEGKDQVVTPELAWSLAGEIVRERKGPLSADKDSGARKSGPFRHATDFGRWLEMKVKSSEIKREHHAALYINAINPHSSQLRFGTAPWNFRTLDVYHLEARVALNNRAGEQIAESSVREVVEIGSDAVASATLDSQDDFEMRLAMGSGAKWVTTYPFGVAWKSKSHAHIQPAIRGPKSILYNIYPSVTRGQDMGDVRLEPVRMLLPGAQVEEHFDNNHYADGHYTGYDQAYTRPVKDTFMGRTDNMVRPFSMSFWWRPYSDQDWTVFDTGVEEYMNRFALFVQDGEKGQELTFRCSAGNNWRQAAEVYVPMEQLDYEPGTWYHIHVSCLGEDPATMQLLIDGVDIGKRRGMTRTSGSVTMDSEEIAVESTDGFPVRGSIRIGREIIEYETLTDSAFRDCFRGQRGTAALEYPANTPVYINGYSMPLTVDVMKGGASINERLGKWSALRISTMTGTPAPDTVPVVLDGMTTPIILAGFGPEQRNISVTGVGMWGQDDAEGAEAFPTRGLALMGCPEIANATTGSGGPAGPAANAMRSIAAPADGEPLPEQPEGDEGPEEGGEPRPGDGVPPGREVPDGEGGGDPVPVPDGEPAPDTGDGGGEDPAAGGGSDIKLGGWEVVYYERSGNEFTIERYVKSAWQGEADPYFLITENQTAQTEFPAFLVPISVMASGGTEQGQDYLDPSEPAHETILTRYYPNEPASAYVALSTDGVPEGELEIIRYDSIERNRAAPDILFVRDRNIGGVTSHFFGNSQTLAGGSATPDPDDTEPPVPPLPDEEPPVPPPPGDDTPDLPPQDGPDSPEEGGDPTPGDGLPPGQRQPTDPTGDDGGEPTDPGGGGDTGDGDGTGDDDGAPLPSPGPGGDVEPGDDEGEDGEPIDPTDDGSGSGGGGGGPLDPQDGEGGEEEGGSFDGGDDVGPGDRPGGDADGGGAAPGDGAGDGPPEEEPAPDESGGGSGGGEEEEGDAKIPSVPPGTRDPSDGDAGGDQEDNGDEIGNGAVWEPEGPTTAAAQLRFRGYVGDNPQQQDGGGDALAARLGLDHGGASGDNLAYFLPCFRAWEASNGAALARTGRNDVITISTGGEEPTRVEVGVRWGDPTSDWTALDDWVENRVEAPATGATTRRNDPRGYPRILRFPCGELPDDMSQDVEFGQSQLSGAGLVTAFLDELFVWRHTHDTRLFVNNNDGLTEEGDEIRIANGGTNQDLSTLDGYDRKCGLVLVGGELIAYRDSRMEGTNTLVLEGCERGIMGTATAFHPIGDPLRFLPDLPVSYLEGGMTAEGASVPMARTNGWPKEGTVRILREDTAEMVHYTRMSNGELLMPESIDNDNRSRGRGLFRGRYGTDATDHDSREIVLFQPFRFWDRYTPRRGESADAFDGIHDHPECSYLELGSKARSALWRGFTWSENLRGRLSGSDGGVGNNDGSEASSGYMDIYVLARFNPNVPWDTDQIVDLRQDQGMGRKADLSGKQNSHLFIFDDTGSSAIGHGRSGNELNVESDTAEFRLYFVYKANAFTPVDSARRGGGGSLEEPVLSNPWKQTPWLRAFSLNYFSRTETRYKAVER